MYQFEMLIAIDMIKIVDMPSDMPAVDIFIKISKHQNLLITIISTYTTVSESKKIYCF